MMGGTMYQGQMKNNKKEGKGFVKYVNGSSYDGDFLNDKKHGHGISTWIDGTKYIGQWQIFFKKNKSNNLVKYKFNCFKP